MVQWLSIHLPVKGTQVWSLVPEDPRFHRIPKPVYHSYLSPHALEPGKAPQWEARTLQLESSPRSTTTSFPGSSDGKASACNAGELVGKIPWRRKWHPTPALLPGKFHGWRSLVGYSPWGRKESDTTEQPHWHWPQLEKACTQQQRPSTTKNK